MANALSVIFKPTSICNLRCKYCYADRDRVEFSGAISEENARKVFDWILAYCKHLNVTNVVIIWHGGEPLLMGDVFINNIIEYYTQLYSKHNIQVRNQIQTNLTLATEKFIPLFKKYFDSRVGFSLDYKSKLRILPNGEDATDAILERAVVMKNAGIDIGAISMMSSDIVGKMHELYDWFKELGIPFRLNKMFSTSSLNTCGITTSVNAEQYAKEVCNLFDIWLNDQTPVHVETLEVAVMAYLRNKSVSCGAEGLCSNSFLCVAHNGTLTPCGRFDLDTYSIGNCFQDSVETVLKRKLEMTKNISEYPFPEKCRACKWNRFCVAGCLHARLFSGVEDECISNTIIWEHIDKRLSAIGLRRGLMEHISKEEAGELLKKMGLR